MISMKLGREEGEFVVEVKDPKFLRKGKTGIGDAGIFATDSSITVENKGDSCDEEKYIVTVNGTINIRPGYSASLPYKPQNITIKLTPY